MTQIFLPTDQISAFVGLLQNSVSLFLPETALLITFLLAIILDLVFKKSKNISGYTALCGFIATGATLLLPYTSQSLFTEMTAIDPFAQFFKFIILIASFVIVLVSFYSDELYKSHSRLGEYFTLIIGMTFGMFLLTSSTNLIMIYLAIEMMSISSYILAGYTKEVKRASEASLKYVIYGAASSGFMIYGISIIYGITGSLNLESINGFLTSNPAELTPLYVAVMMIMVGFGYKISAVPFHFWTPDVYEGSPITITSLLSVASKAAGFAGLIRFIKTAFVVPAVANSSATWTMAQGVDWGLILWLFAVLSMTVGNLVALWQNNIKRMLAYSAIAHAGYLLVALSTLSDGGVKAIMVYFGAYLLMNLGAFYCAQLIQNKTGSDDIDEYNGMGNRSPLLAICFSICLVSLAGLPPTFGFIGKVGVFSAAMGTHSYWLVTIGVLNSVISLVYYAKVMRNMFLRKADEGASVLEYKTIEKVVLIALSIPIIFLGLFPQSIIDWASKSIYMIGR